MVHNENPYASPAVRAERLPPVSVDRVDGDCIVVSNGSVLPNRCVVTNVPCDLSDQRIKKFRYAPSFHLVVSRRTCRLYYCLSAMYRKRIYLIRAILFASIFATLWFFCGTAIIAAVVATIFIFSLPADHLRVVNCRDGEFWIRGFHRDFLESLVAEDGWRKV